MAKQHHDGLAHNGQQSYQAPSTERANRSNKASSSNLIDPASRVSVNEPCCHETRLITNCHSEANKQVPSTYFQRSRKAVQEITIPDSDFIIRDEALPRESLVQQNIYQIMHDHMDVIGSKCLEAKLPVLKQSLYKKDFVPMPIDASIRGSSSNPVGAFKANAKLPINSIHRVCCVEL